MICLILKFWGGNDQQAASLYFWGIGRSVDVGLYIANFSARFSPFFKEKTRNLAFRRSLAVFKRIFSEMLSQKGISSKFRQDGSKFRRRQPTADGI